MDLKLLYRFWNVDIRYGIDFEEFQFVVSELAAEVLEEIPPSTLRGKRASRIRDAVKFYLSKMAPLKPPFRTAVIELIEKMYSGGGCTP